MKLKTINLQDIDGYEFEKVCAEIFQNMNYGQVELTPPVGDAGKDIILHTPHGKIIVECKHYLNSSVGRPVIQKLHSAVISENGIKGMVVTTGRFSKNAIEHAKTLIPPIELVDFEILNDWALKANIDLVTSHKKSKIYSFPISSENRIENILASKLSNLLVSKPYQVQDQFLMKERNTKLIPLYVIGYRLNSVFKTSVGVIHQEYSEGKLFFSADSGELYPEGIIRYFHSSPMWEINPNELMDINVGSYRFRANDVKEAAVQYITGCCTDQMQS